MKLKKILLKIINCIINILILIISLIILIGIYYLFQLQVLKNNYANIFGYTFFQVATGSMSPTIEIGDVVMVKITDNVEKNDIIVYEDEKNYITHRLIDIKDDSLITSGDANNTDDKPVNKDKLLGKVKLIIPKLGIWREILLQPEIMLGIISVILLFGITFVYTSNSEEKNE